MSTFSFERNGKLVEDIDITLRGRNLCTLGYDELMNADNEFFDDVMYCLLSVADDIFEYNGDRVIDTNITLVDEDKNFIWGFCIEGDDDDGGGFSYRFIDFLKDGYHFCYVDNNEILVKEKIDSE